MDDKILEIEEFAKLPDPDKIVAIYGMSYRTHKTVQTLPCISKRNCGGTSTAERVGIWSGIVLGALAVIGFVVDFLMRR